MTLADSFLRVNDNNRHKPVGLLVNRSSQVDRNKKRERGAAGAQKKQRVNNVDRDKGRREDWGWFNNKRLETQKTKSKMGRGRKREEKSLRTLNHHFLKSFDPQQ